MEKELEASARGHWWRPSPAPVEGLARPSPEALMRLASRLGMEQRTDYSTALRLLRRLRYAVASLAGPRDVLAAPLAWRQPGSASQFHPLTPDLASALQLVRDHYRSC